MESEIELKPLKKKGSIVVKKVIKMLMLAAHETYNKKKVFSNRT